MKLRRWLLWLLTALLALCLAACQAPGGEHSAPGAETPCAGESGMTVEAGGAAIAMDTQGWSEALAAQAVAVEWDEEIRMIPEGSASIGAVSVECVPLNHMGQALLTEWRAQTVAPADGQGAAFVHTPYGGLWDIPLGQNDPVLTGYHISAQVNGQLQDRYFVVRSPRPAISSVSLREALQGALEGDRLLRRLEAAGDVDGDGVENAVTVAVTAERIPFLAVDGTAVLCMMRNDPSYYEYAHVLAMDLDGDGLDEVAIVDNNLGAVGIQCADWDDGTWRECPLEQGAFALALEDDFTLVLTCPDGTEQIIAAQDDPDIFELVRCCFDPSGAPYSREAAAAFALDDPAYTVEDGGVCFQARLDVEAVAMIEGERHENYTITAFCIPAIVSVRDGQMVMSYGPVIAAQ